MIIQYIVHLSIAYLGAIIFPKVSTVINHPLTMRVLIFKVFTFCLIIQTSIALDATTASDAKTDIETYFKTNNGWLAKTIRLSKVIARGRSIFFVNCE